MISTMINSYAAFLLTCQNIIDYFENGKMENIVVLNTIQGNDMISYHSIGICASYRSC